jgi:hypothetical protein
VFLERIGPSLWHRQAMPVLGVALVVVAFAVFAVTRMRRRA